MRYTKALTYLLTTASVLAMSTAVHAQPAGSEVIPANQSNDAAVLKGGAAAMESPPSGSKTGGLEQVVVTSQKREENLQQVPIAVTAVTEIAMKRASIDAGADLPRITPNLAINSGSNFFSPYLRGIGTQYATMGLESSVAVYLDDLYISRPTGGLASFNDIARIEVLKGPQGTLFGRNAAGGAIRIITNDPVFDFEGSAAVTYGRFDRLGLEGVLNVPLSSKVAARVAYYHDDRGGFIRNIDPDKPKMGNRNIDMFRGKVLINVSDNFTIKISGDYSDKNDFEGSSFINLEGAPNQLAVAIGGTPSPDFYTGTQDFPSTKDQSWYIRQAGASIRADWELEDFTVSSISGYRWAAAQSYADLDTVDLPLQHNTFYESSDSYSQEIQAVSRQDGNFNWMVGGYYFQERGGNFFTLFGSSVNGLFGVPVGPNVGEIGGGPSLGARARLNVESFAPYAQVTYDFTDQWQLLVGVRYTRERKVLASNYAFATGLAPTDVVLFTEADSGLKFEKFTPKASLSFRPTDDMLLYVSFSRGFKSGGINTPTLAPATTVRPETLDSYEFGWKTEFGNVRLNGSAFYYDFKDLQVQRTDQTSGGIRVENAGGAQIYGAEAELTWVVSDYVELGGSVGLLQSNYRQYIGDAYVPCATTPAAAGCAAQGGLGYGVLARDFNGDTLALAPKATFNLHGQYTQPLADGLGSLRLNGLASYSSSYFSNPEHSLEESSRVLLSLRLSWVSDDENYEVSVFGDNILNEKFNILKNRQNSGGWRIPGPPATWGIRASAKF